MTITAEPVKPARIRDEIADAIRQLVALGKIRPGDRDTVVIRHVGDHLQARGSPAPSERSFRRYLPGLRVMWRTAK